MYNRGILLATLGLPLVISCGGGGGGGSAPHQSASELSLSISPNSVNGQALTTQNSRTLSFELTVDNWSPETTLYVNTYSDNIALNQVQSSQGSQNSFYANIITKQPWLLGAGIYTGQVTFAVSTDSEGSDQINNSPQTAPVTFTVYGPAINFISPNEISSGGPSFTITLTGSGFLSNHKIYWDYTSLDTNYVSSTELTAQVPAEFINISGLHTIQISNGLANGMANPFYVAVRNPTSAPASISPNQVVAGGPTFTITVTQTEAQWASILYWNSTPLKTTVVSAPVGSAIVATAQVPASEITNAGMATIFLFDQNLDRP